MATRIKTIFKTAARQSPPVAIKAPIGPGKVQGAVKTTSLTKPNFVANQAIVAKTIGAKIKGIIKIGFKTIGTPKITGSLILKIDGAKIAFPSFEPYSDFARKANNIAKPIVAPAPPIQMNHW